MNAKQLAKMDVLIRRLGRAADEMHRRRADVLAARDRIKERLEAEAANGDADAADILAECRFLETAVLCPMPDPDRPAYWIPVWMPPTPETTP